MRLVAALLSLLLCITVFAQQPSSPPATADRLYLPPQQSEGSNWCLDPFSARLRQILTTPASPLPGEVNGDDLAKDLVELQELLRTQYPGYGTVAQLPGFDVGRFFADWRARVAGKRSLPYAEVVLAPLRELRDAVVDQHLSVAGAADQLNKGSLMDVREFQATVDQDLDLKSCKLLGARRVYGSTLRMARLISSQGIEKLVTVTAAADGPLSLECNGKTWTLTERAARLVPKPKDDEPFYHWSSIGDTAVVRIRHLYGSTKDLENLSQIPKDFQQHAKFRRIIFDLRGNGGGDDTYVYSWISEAKNGTWPSGAETKRIGELYPCGDWNMTIIRQVTDYTIDTEGARKEREVQRGSWSPAPNEHEIFSDGLISDTSAHPYSGRIYVLTDRQSKSSGESSAYILRQALGALLVGERTGGMITYGNVRTVVLRRTGISFNVPTKRNWFNEPAEVVGYPVDLYLENNAIPVQDLIPMLDQFETRSGAANR